ncbi:uncharacterized protein LOC119164496 [Rhipicephalus microplus]|uniref:uncharacterized protein LOC119164496 n=1 Tax=Rhipicephalus microplus TaxID=6941 RepID=UPI003F6B6738
MKATMLYTDAILVLLGCTLCTLATTVFSYPSSPVYGRLQRNAASYADGQYAHADPNYYALLRSEVPLGAPASSPDWGQFLPAPWTGAVDAYAGPSVVVPPVVPQYEDYADEYDSSATGIQFPPGASPNLGGYDWYEAQARAEQQQQQEAQLEQQEMQEAAVLKDLLANYLSKKSSDSAAPASDPEKRSETAKKYTVASGGVRVKSTTAKPNVAALTVPREKGTAAVASAHGPSLSVTSPPVPQPTGSSLSAAEASEAHTVPVSQEGGQKEYAMFRPVGTAESRRPTFWRGGVKQTKTEAAAMHAKATRSRFGHFADDTLTEELDQLKSQ